MPSTTHSRTKVSFQSTAQDTHSSPPCFSEIQWPSLCRATFQSRLSPAKDILWSMDWKNQNLSLTEFTVSSKAPINYLFGCHDYYSESWCPVKSGKSVSNGKYHKEKETKLYKWLMKNLAKKIEGESSFHCIIHWIHRWKISAHDYYSDDDVLAHSNSDSDILATVEKANLSNFWTMIAQRWLVLKAI